MPIVAALLFLFNSLVSLAIFLVIVTAILSWLVAFDVINLRNPAMYRIVKTLDQLTEPMLRPIPRRHRHQPDHPAAAASGAADRGGRLPGAAGGDDSDDHVLTGPNSERLGRERSEAQHLNALSLGLLFWWIGPR